MVLLTDESRIPILRLVDGFFVTQPENFIPFDLAIYLAHAQFCWDLYFLVLGVCLEASQILRKK